MASGHLVADTNIFIEYLRAKDKRKTILFSIPDEITIFVSAVTIYELYMGANTEAKKKDIHLLTDELTVLSFNDQVAKQVAEIYHEMKRVNQLIEFRDLFIGATCIVNDFPLKTTKIRHFSRISGLKFL